MKFGHIVKYNNEKELPQNAPLMDDPTEYLKKIQIIGNIGTK